MAFRKETTMNIYGLKELEKLMAKELPAAMSRQAVLGAMRASAKPMEKAAKAMVPNKGGKASGALADSIGLKTVPVSKSKYFAVMTLSPLSGDLAAWTKWMQHYGRTLNVINPRTGKADANAVGRIRHGHLVEFGFRHPSGKHVPARPFMRNAFDMTVDKYGDQFYQRLKTRIDNAIKKLNFVGPKAPRKVMKARGG